MNDVEDTDMLRTRSSRLPLRHPLLGYLYPMEPGTYAGREQPILLKAACLCGKWHTHGAGTVQRPIPMEPGTRVRRASHCSEYAYTEITVEAEPFRPIWSTPRGRISAAYRVRAA